MAHFDRGVYQPSDDMRVFDGAEEEEDVEGSRLPLLIVLALLVLAMFAGVVWLAYTQGVARGRTETPVLTAQNGPARVAPANDGNAEQAYKGFKIYEQPAPPDEDVDSTTAAAGPSVPQLKPSSIPANPTSATAPAKPPSAAPKVAAAVPAPAPVKPAPAAVKPAAPPPPLAMAKNQPPAVAAPRPVATPPKPVPAVTPVNGSFALQIGAYKSHAEADAAWASYKSKHGALLAGAASDVQQADLGEKGTWYRLRITGFPSKDVATAMCERLRTDGGACFLGK